MRVLLGITFVCVAALSLNHCSNNESLAQGASKSNPAQNSTQNAGLDYSPVTSLKMLVPWTKRQSGGEIHPEVA